MKKIDKKKYTKNPKTAPTEKVKMASETALKADDHQEEKPFDWGGLPNRDLKKNLGCG